jgi:two-component system, NtrC family, nitrogen regulation sensor histidine kinase NtrY
MNLRTKNTRLYAAGFVMLLLAVLVFVQAAFDLNPLVGDSSPKQVVVLYAVSTLIFLTLIVFGFILARTLFKVWTERKQQKPGSRFKTSVVVTLVSLTLVPAVLLFLFGFGLVNRSIDKWFSRPVDNIFSATAEIGQEWRREHETMVRGILDYLSRNYPEDLDLARRTLAVKSLMVLAEDGQVTASAADQPPAEDIRKGILVALGKQQEVIIQADPYWIGARRIQTPDGPRILAAVFATPQRILDLMTQISREHERYLLLNESRKSWRDTTVMMLALMTVLVLFAAVWIGLNLSKRITVPIEALSVATRELSSGNLDHRVDIQAEHELGLLVKLFNDMAGRLKFTTEELEARRRYTEVILESIPTGVISLDTNMRINTMNRAAHSMFSSEGASRLEHIFSGEDLDSVNLVIAAARDAESGSEARDLAFVTPGAPAHSTVTASRLMAGGFVLVVEDLTEVVRAQKASAWREVARRLAHEIKNPLTPIQLSAERIGRNVSRLPSASPRVTTVIGECVEAIIEEVSSLKHLVDEFVRFARLPAVSRVPNSMKELVDRTMALYEGRLHGASVMLCVPDDLPPVLMDPLQMKRVLVNVIDNALEALTEENTQELRISCELARGDTMARLTIADSGRGIASDDRERLFMPYFSTRKNGTGLGLAISSRIVADHGGYIGVEPNLPKGTRFIIELPVCQES